MWTTSVERSKVNGDNERFKAGESGLCGKNKKKITWICFIFTLITREAKGLSVWTFKEKKSTLDGLLNYYSTNPKVWIMPLLIVHKMAPLPFLWGQVYECNRGEHNYNNCQNEIITASWQHTAYLTHPSFILCLWRKQYKVPFRYK